jgi:N-acetylglucosaminyldiphosphoundecaprenol N-acetyl-beta-D-mannosaminyltransferase
MGEMQMPASGARHSRLDESLKFDPARHGPDTRPWPATHIGAVRVDRVTVPQAISTIAALIDGGVGGFVVTPNVDHIVLAETDPELRRAYHEAALSLADGQPVVWMSQLLGQPVPVKISGADFIWDLLAAAEREEWGVFFVGATPSVSQEAIRRIQERFPRIHLAGADTATWRADIAETVRTNDLLERIRNTGARIIIVALGCPKQERWMLRHAAALRPAVAIGLGGSLDFAAGAVRRAPAWISMCGLEWLFRLVQEPRRLAYRYLVRDAHIVPIFARAWTSRWLRHAPVAPARPA